MRRIKDITHNGKPLADILSDHKKWLAGAGGQQANLIYSDLSYSDLHDADLSYADLSNADLHGADLSYANLSEANLREANLSGANLSKTNLNEANLSRVTLCCFGNMKEIRTMQIDTWAIEYTADTLQIGCQRHAIDKWRKWATPAGRKWIQSMDKKALEWADRNLALVLQIIDANPATPTGHEKND